MAQAAFTWLLHHISDVGVTPPELIALILIVCVTSFIRGITGFGFGIGTVPLMSLVVSPRLAIGVSIVLPLIFGLLDFPKLWPQCNRPVMGRLVLGAVVGTPLGMLLLTVLPIEYQRLIVAFAATYALVAVYLFKDATRLGLMGQPTIAGFGGGVLNGLAGMPGAPVVAYMLTSPITSAMARSSLVVFFLATGIAGTVAGAATGVVNSGSLLISAACLLPFFLGNKLGQMMFSLSDAAVFRRAGLALLIVGAASAAWRGLAGLL